MTPCKYQEFEAALEDLYQGRRVVVPHDIDHAYNMLKVAGAYIQDHRNRCDTRFKNRFGVTK